MSLAVHASFPLIAFSLVACLCEARPLATAPADEGRPAVVRGTVTDPDGRAAAGARVVLDADAAPDITAVVDAEGRFAFNQVRPGRYELRVLAEGLGADPVPLALPAGDVRDVAITLRITPVQEAIVVSASQIDRPRSALGDSLTLFTERDLRDRQVESLSDALGLVPGVTVARNGGRGAVTSLFPRGGESDFTMVLIDGVRLNDFGGAFDFAHLPVEQAERVEVVRGPQSALYGSDAIGGVVHVVTRHGGPPRGSALVEGGSFGTMRMAGSGAGVAGGWSWGGAAEGLSTDGFTGIAPGTGERVTNDDYQRTVVTGSGGYLGRSSQVTALAQWGRNERGFPGPFGSDPNDTYSGVDRISRGEDEPTAFAIAGRYSWSPALQARAQFSAADRESAFVSAFGDSAADNHLRAVGAQLDYQARESLGASVGVETLGERAGSTFITNTASAPIDVERRVTGVFGEARWTLDRLSLTAGVRAERIHRKRLEGNDDPFAPRPEFAADTVVSVDPKVAASWLARPEAGGTWTRVRGSAGTGIRPPSAFEIAFTDNPSLAPERSRSVEVGVEQGLISGWAIADATFFFNDYDNLIVAVGRSFQDASQFRTDNVSNARARGVELAVAVRPRLGLSIRVGYTWLDTEILAVDGQSGLAPPPFTVGDQLVRRPRHRGFLDLVYSARQATFFARVNSRGRVLDVDPSFGAFGGTFIAPGFAVVDLGGSYAVWRSIEFTARVTNVFDRRYEEAFGFPALGRSVMAGARIRIGDWGLRIAD